jgi:hypothetical protein
VEGDRGGGRGSGWQGKREVEGPAEPRGRLSGPRRLTARSRCVRARSTFFVWVRRMLPSWRWVRASTRGGGLKLNTAWRHCMQDLMLGGLEVRKFSARPKSDRYQASWEDAIFTCLARSWDAARQVDRARELPGLGPQASLAYSRLRSSRAFDVRRTLARGATGDPRGIRDGARGQPPLVCTQAARGAAGPPRTHQSPALTLYFFLLLRVLHIGGSGWILSRTRTSAHLLNSLIACKLC